jgi:twitching motility protein PilI
MPKDKKQATDPIISDVPEISQPETYAEVPEVKVEPVFGIRIGTMGLLISTTRFCEVLDKVQVNALPNVHPWISGILNLRGNLVPVFDLRVVLEEGAGDNKKRRLFAVDRDEKAVALWIDNYPEIKNRAVMQPLKQLPELPQILQRFVTNGYELDGHVWLDVKFEELFRALGSHQYTTGEMAT